MKVTAGYKKSLYQCLYQGFLHSFSYKVPPTINISSIQSSFESVMTNHILSTICSSFQAAVHFTETLNMLLDFLLVAKLVQLKQ